MLNKILKRSIGNIETFIQNNETHYRKMFYQHNISHINKLLNCKGINPSNLILNKTQKNQIETRILKIVHQGGFADLKEFTFQHDLRKDWNMDQLSITALIASIEEEFNTVFDIHVYEDVKTLMDVVELLQEDQKIV